VTRPRSSPRGRAIERSFHFVDGAGTHGGRLEKFESKSVEKSLDRDVSFVQTRESPFGQIPSPTDGPAARYHCSCAPAAAATHSEAPDLRIEQRCPTWASIHRHSGHACLLTPT